MTISQRIWKATEVERDAIKNSEGGFALVGLFIVGAPVAVLALMAYAVTSFFH